MEGAGEKTVSFLIIFLAIVGLVLGVFITLMFFEGVTVNIWSGGHVGAGELREKVSNPLRYELGEIVGVTGGRLLEIESVAVGGGWEEKKRDGVRKFELDIRGVGNRVYTAKEGKLSRLSSWGGGRLERLKGRSVVIYESSEDGSKYVVVVTMDEDNDRIYLINQEMR